MTGLPALLLALTACAQEGGYERAMVALEQEQYGAAWRELEAEDDPVSRGLGRAALFLRAGDPAGQLHAAEAGLEIEPEHLDLLFYASHAALWLRDASRADAYVERLGRAIRAAELPGSFRVEWEARHESFRASADELVTLAAGQRRDLLRARVVTLGTLAGSGALFLGIVLRGGPAGRSGTPAPRA